MSFECDEMAHFCDELHLILFGPGCAHEIPDFCRFIRQGTPYLPVSLSQLTIKQRLLPFGMKHDNTEQLQRNPGVLTSVEKHELYFTSNVSRQYILLIALFTVDDFFRTYCQLMPLISLIVSEILILASSNIF